MRGEAVLAKVVRRDWRSRCRQRHLAFYISGSRCCPNGKRFSAFREKFARRVLMMVSRAFKAGATGYLLKDAAPEDQIEAFDKVRRGIPYLSRPSLPRTCPKQTR